MQVRNQIRLHSTVLGYRRGLLILVNAAGLVLIPAFRGPKEALVKEGLTLAAQNNFQDEWISG
jgi:hypothetical protein